MALTDAADFAVELEADVPAQATSANGHVKILACSNGFQREPAPGAPAQLLASVGSCSRGVQLSEKTHQIFIGTAYRHLVLMKPSNAVKFTTVLGSLEPAVLLEDQGARRAHFLPKSSAKLARDRRNFLSWSIVMSRLAENQHRRSINCRGGASM